MFAFLSGKSYELYDLMLTQLKNRAAEEDLLLKSSTIHCDFEKGAIKAFKFHFPGVKIIGCHFHFSSAIFKKIVDLGLKTAYVDSPTFKKWVRMVMALNNILLRKESPLL